MYNTTLGLLSGKCWIPRFSSGYWDMLQRFWGGVVVIYSKIMDTVFSIERQQVSRGLMAELISVNAVSKSLHNFDLYKQGCRSQSLARSFSNFQCCVIHNSINGLFPLPDLDSDLDSDTDSYTMQILWERDLNLNLSRWKHVLHNTM